MKEPIDQFGEVVKVGDYVLHNLPLHDLKTFFCCSKVIGIKGTKVVTDMEEREDHLSVGNDFENKTIFKSSKWRPLEFFKYIKIPEDYGKSHNRLPPYEYGRYESTESDQQYRRRPEAY